jgi:hypothetical protein
MIARTFTVHPSLPPKIAPRVNTRVDFSSLLQGRDTLSTIEKKSEIELSPLPQHWNPERTKF